MTQPRLCCLRIFISALAFCGPAVAQVERAKKTSAPMPGVTIQVASEATSASVTTDSGGASNVANVQAAAPLLRAEFKVLTNNAGVEYGRAGGAVVFTNKSGTNAFHRSVFEFFRNSANPSLPKPPFRLNQFGGSIGGPIARNKVFFFGNYEEYREVFGDTQSVSEQRRCAGGFSGCDG